MTSFTFWGEMPRVLALPPRRSPLAEGMAPELKADTSIYVASAEGDLRVDHRDGRDGERATTPRACRCMRP